MRKRTRSSQVIALLAILTVVYAVGFVGSYAMNQGLAGWYASAPRPNWAPPIWGFVPVSSLFYGFVGFGIWELWKSPAPAKGIILVMSLFALWASAWAWTLFIQQNAKLSCVIGIAELIVIVATLPFLCRESKPAGGLMCPYLLWRMYMVALSASLMLLNVAKVKT